MEKKTTQEFWTVVFSRAWERARKGTDMKWVMRGLLLGSITALLLGCGLLFRLVPEQYVGETIFRNNWVGLATVIVGFIGLVIDFVVAIKDIPTEFYNEQVEQINVQNSQIKELKDTWEGDLAQANFSITSWNDLFFENRIGIRIYNGYFRQNITHLSVKLNRLQLKVPRDTPLHEEISNAEHEFIPDSNLILPRHDVVVYLAEAKRDELVFRLGNGYHFKDPLYETIWNSRIGTANFEIELSIDGMVNDRAIRAEIVKSDINWTLVPYNWERDKADGKLKPIDPPQIRSHVHIGEIIHEPQKETASDSTTK